MASPLAAAPQLESLSPLFMVPPRLNPNSSGLLNLSPLQSPFGMSHQQALAHVTAQAALSQSFKQMQADMLRHQATNPSPSKPEPLKLESISEISQSDKKPDDKPASDGYNWRKYGQKHVKASECPRSYYKCTHLNCPVKKKVERTLDGRISEITYKGEHNHDLRKHNKRGKDICTLDTENMASQGRIEIDRLKEGLNADSESENFQTATKTVFEHHPDISSNYDMEDNAIIVHEGVVDEPISKRRSLDIGPSVPTSASSHQAVLESKIVLRTRSEVDLLEDGYKWRKYGQKVVKGNPHPRSYYRCTYPGCNVRKHIERASADPKAIITTYEGKHNHDIPIGRHSSHGAASSSAQKIKTQKTVSKNLSLNKEIDYEDKEHIPMTLQLKEGQIVA